MSVTPDQELIAFLRELAYDPRVNIGETRKLIYAAEVLKRLAEDLELAGIRTTSDPAEAEAIHASVNRIGQATVDFARRLEGKGRS